MHAYRDGRAPGLARVEQLGVQHVVFPATGTSEDVAMLLADDKGAELIVAVGTHATLVEFLDKGRSGMASTFLTRLRVGGKLVDAKGVSRLYRHRISNLQLTLLVLAGPARPRGRPRVDRRGADPVRPDRRPLRRLHLLGRRSVRGSATAARALHGPGATATSRRRPRTVIDFRYHIVSLISVFLALAVGIALGAGPLKETIGDTLTGQVEQLRAEKDALRADLDDATRATSRTPRPTSTPPARSCSTGTLTDRRVAVVALGTVDDADGTAIDDRLTQSGATVTAHVTLTDAWTDPDARTFRQALVGQLLHVPRPRRRPTTPASRRSSPPRSCRARRRRPDDRPTRSPTTPPCLLAAPLVERERQPARHRARIRSATPADAVVVVAACPARDGLARRDARRPHRRSPTVAPQLAVVDRRAGAVRGRGAGRRARAARAA